jgi:hypothetical protein
MVGPSVTERRSLRKVARRLASCRLPLNTTQSMSSPSSTMTPIRSGNLKFDAPGRPRAMSKRRAGPSFGLVPPSPLSPHASKKGGADGSFLFIPCRARVFPATPFHDPRQHQPGPSPASSLPVKLVGTDGCTATGPRRRGVLVVLDRAIRGGRCDLRIAISTHRNMISQHCFSHTRMRSLVGDGVSAPQMNEKNPAIGFDPACTWRIQAPSSAGSCEDGLIRYHTTTCLPTCLPELSH